jgi:hypothetical protein
MDPNETFLAFFNAICVNDREGAYGELESLVEWLGKGGFAPKLYSWWGHIAKGVHAVSRLCRSSLSLSLTHPPLKRKYDAAAVPLGFLQENGCGCRRWRLGAVIGSSNWREHA